MENPFSAPKPNPTESPVTPPDKEKPQPAAGELSSVPGSTFLPPVREEIENSAPSQPVQSGNPATGMELPPVKEDASTTQNSFLDSASAKTEAPAVEPKNEGQENGSENNEDESASSTPPLAAQHTPKPKPKPMEQPVAAPVHHQPVATYAPQHLVAQGWSDADFDDEDGSELPALTMEERSCRMCKYFRFNEGERSEIRFGECRRNAPKGAGKALWPSVLWDSWCGEWEIGVSQGEMMQMARTAAENIGK